MSKETRKQRRERVQKQARTADSGQQFDHDGKTYRFDGQPGQGMRDSIHEQLAGH